MSQRDWIDLAAATSQREVLHADVCVVGAGAAGIYLAVQLARKKLRVVLLEAGAATCAGASVAGFEALFEASPYPGATEGRFFGMGGTTACWGGQLVPHTGFDLRSGTDSAETWQCIMDSVADNAVEVLQRLGFRQHPEFAEYASRTLGPAAEALQVHGLASQAGLMMPFRSKNLVGLLGRRSGSCAPRVFYNAVVKSWTVEPGISGNSRITAVVAESSNRNQLQVSAAKFVLAAGAIETARILLEIDESADQPVLRPGSAVGRCLGDHLSVAIADVAPESLDLAAKLFAPRFSGAWMRGFRFLERDPPDIAPRAFAHFVFENRGKGFRLAKEMLGALQARRMPRIALPELAGGLADAMRIAYRRLVNAVLHVPKGTPVRLQLDMEQTPDEGRLVRLATQRDAFGRRMASICWQISDRDRAQISAVAERFLAKWPGEQGGLPRLQSRPIHGDVSKPHDAYHPVGCCRMGEDAEAVVDHEMRVHGLQNLWVSSTAVLPSAGTANPTFSMLCLTHRLAQRLHAEH